MRKTVGFATALAAACVLEGCCTCVPAPPADDRYLAATFTVDGTTAEMNGVIDFTTPEVVRTLFSEHPDLTTIVMVDVPGAADDPENIEAARKVRAHGVTTVVPSDGVIASGGVDFFLAGKTRIIEPCAKLGVHDWEDEDDDDVTVRGFDLPRDHPMHAMFLDYYRDMEIPEAFYWYTLEVAPPERIHWMSDEEILVYEMATD
ncbi:MAG: hypothetical protein MUP13_00065 [Thermoanaerobaculales bacterium]|nr:hypothetical protein [Thermoanaerobaculales bacterium]